MNKRGFTLTELLVVVALIGVLALLVVPNVMKVRSNINDRLYTEKIDYILSAAEMYASNNPDYFASGDSAQISVAQLIAAGYLKSDGKGIECSKYFEEPTAENNLTEGSFKDIDSVYNLQEKRCLIDPRYGSSINNMVITVTKKNVGIVAEVSSGSENSLETNSLVVQVCAGFANNNFYGKYDVGANDYCMCNSDYMTSTAKLYKATRGADGKLSPTETRVSQCILVSNKDNGDIDNWVKYGATSANWRVVGLYEFDTDGDGDKEVSAKIITSSIIQ